MRIIDKQKIMVEQENLIAIICNMCGNRYENNRMFQANEVQNFQIAFGFGSFHDGQVWQFDLCDTCLDRLIVGFKVEPIIQYSFGR